MLGTCIYLLRSIVLLDKNCLQSQSPDRKSFTVWLVWIWQTSKSIVHLNKSKAAEFNPVKQEVSHSSLYKVNECSLPGTSFLSSVTRKNSPNVYKNCPKMMTLEKWKNWTPLQKMPKNVVDMDKVIVAKCFKNLPKVQ